MRSRGLLSAVCLYGAILALGDAIFLAPCLWRRTRSVTPGSQPLLRARRFLTTDADACNTLCRVPLFPTGACQRCCQAAGLPVPAAINTTAALLAALGLPANTAGQTLPLVPLSQLQALLNQLLAAGSSAQGTVLLGQTTSLTASSRPSPSNTASTAGATLPSSNLNPNTTPSTTPTTTTPTTTAPTTTSTSAPTVPTKAL